MGICASSQTGEKGGVQDMGWASTTKIIHVDGRLQEFRQAIRAGHIISQNPKCFLCSSESMYLNSYMIHVAEDEELQLGQLYFLMPLTHSHNPLSLSDLCTLAVKASTARTEQEASLLSGSHNVRFRSTSQGGCKIPAGFDIMGLSSQLGSGRGIGYS